jgi:hypothetical protein
MSFYDLLSRACWVVLLSTDYHHQGWQLEVEFVAGKVIIYLKNAR